MLATGSGIENNNDLKCKTERVQNEFDRVLTELLTQRNKQAIDIVTDNLDISDDSDNYIEATHHEGFRPEHSRHVSPTSRFTQMKDSIFN